MTLYETWRLYISFIGDKKYQSELVYSRDFCIWHRLKNQIYPRDRNSEAIHKLTNARRVRTYICPSVRIGLLNLCPITDKTDRVIRALMFQPGNGLLVATLKGRSVEGARTFLATNVRRTHVGRKVNTMRMKRIYPECGKDRLIDREDRRKKKKRTGYLHLCVMVLVEANDAQRRGSIHLSDRYQFFSRHGGGFDLTRSCRATVDFRRVQSH